MKGTNVRSYLTRLPVAAGVCVFGLSYFAFSWLGYGLSLKPHYFTPFWLPSGLYLSALLITRMRHWPWYMAAAVTANIAYNYFIGTALHISCLYVLSNTLEAFACAYALRKITGAVPGMQRVKDVVALIIVSVLTTAAISAPIGAVTVVTLMGSEEAFWKIWLRWWSGRALGIAIVTPVLLTAINDAGSFFLKTVARPASSRLALEKICWAILFLITLWLVFLETPREMVLYDYLFWPLLIWAAMRFRISSIFLINLCISLFAAWSVSHGYLPFTARFPETLHPFLSLQVFLLVLVSSGMVVSAISNERRQNQLSLQASEQKFREVFEHAFDGILLADPVSLRIRMANRAMCRLTGYTVQELVSLTIRDLHPAEEHEDHCATIKKALRDSNALLLNRSVKRKDAPAIFVDINVTRFMLGNEQLVLSIFHDISERLKAEKALRENERRFRTIVDNINDAFYIHDFDGTINDCNDNACRMLGYTRDELVGTSMKLFDSPKETQLMPARMKKLMIDGVLVFEGEHIRKDGTAVAVNVSARVVSREKNGVVQSFVRDITLLKRAEDNMLKAEKLESLGILAGGIAHDFNNLLAGIFGNIDLALAEAQSGKAKNAAVFLSRAMTVFERARDLTRQLLTFSKGGAPSRVRGNLATTIGDTIAFALSGSNVKAAFDFSPGLWTCEYDPHQIGQVLDNIAINAKQAMPEGGTLEVDACNEMIESDHPSHLTAGPYVRLRIRDNGIGIPSEYLPKIFDPFFSTKQAGSGLGLATSWSIVSRHKGHIDVQSEPGKGTAFTVYLPASPAGRLIDVKDTVTMKKGEGRILVMDDEKFICDLSVSVLSSLGYTVTCAKDGQEALELFSVALRENRPFKAVILDLTVPGAMGGIETLDRLKKIDPAVRAIASSGYADDPVMAHPENFGFAASIGKPYRQAEIAGVVAAVIAA
ncbi:MAG: PAS domain S-box protein [Chitinispirillaceae bacterium]|nr:PAS domain S-box protein [Chitinispirillaceae bacterium]